jgi:purine-binding chemotaxis protein CheW
MGELIAAARGLNQQVVEARERGLHGQYLTFLAGAELCAVGVLAIREIIEFAGLTVVPMMPDFVRGIINLRGAVVPVLDLQARFGRGQAEVSRRTCIVIVEVEHDDPDEPGPQVLGLVVDAVQAVLDIDPADIEPPPAFGAAIRTDFIAGMARLSGRAQGKFVVLLKLVPLVAIDDAPAAAALPL